MGSAPRARLHFDGRSVEAVEGEPLLRALGRRGWPALVRSVRYHRPRGPFCGVGDCTGCLVRYQGVPNRRACREPVRDGAVGGSENSWPSARFDLFGVIDRLLPNGFDTVHGLRRPAAFRGLYQWAVRRLAGYGRPPDPPRQAPPPARTVATDVAIVGAGRSGRAAAGALASVGLRALVLERRSASEIGEIAGAQLLAGATVTVLAAPAPGARAPFTLLGFGAEGGGLLVRADAVVVATGGYDAGLLFEGSDRPGVVTADLTLSDLELPLGPSVVVGDGVRARAVIDRHGRSVEAIVAFGEIGPDLVRAAADEGIGLYPRSRVLRAVGHGHLRAIELARRDGGGRFRLPCRSLILAHRRLPSAQLLFQAGAARHWREAPGAYFPTIDAAGRTSVPGLYAVGAAAAPPDAGAPEPTALAAAIGAPAPGAPTAPERPGEGTADLTTYYRELLAEPRRGKWILCPCEDVLLEEVEAAAARGYRGLEVIKRYTGVGTGLCQGRYCLPEAIEVLAVLERRAPPEVGFITQRPPMVPTPLGALAGLGAELGQEPVP